MLLTLLSSLLDIHRKGFSFRGAFFITFYCFCSYMCKLNNQIMKQKLKTHLYVILSEYMVLVLIFQDINVLGAINDTKHSSLILVTILYTVIAIHIMIAFIMFMKSTFNDGK